MKQDPKLTWNRWTCVWYWKLGTYTDVQCQKSTVIEMRLQMILEMEEPKKYTRTTRGILDTLKHHSANADKAYLR